MLFLELEDITRHFNRDETDSLTANYGDKDTGYYEQVLVVGVEGANLVYSHPTGDPHQFFRGEVVTKDVDRGYPKPTHARINGIGGRVVEVPLRHLTASNESDHIRYKTNYDQGRRNRHTAISHTDGERIHGVEVALVPLLGSNAAFIASRNTDLSDLTADAVQSTIDLLTTFKDGLNPLETNQQERSND